MNESQFQNQNTSFRYNGIDVNVNYYGGDLNAEYNVGATYRKDERSASVNLRYSHEGARITEVTDLSEPFNSAFYSFLDGYLSSLAYANNLIVSNNSYEDE